MSLLILLSILAIGGGFLFVSEATLGVYVACVGLWLGVMARIAQAQVDHAQLMEIQTKMLNTHTDQIDVPRKELPTQDIWN